jgi:hypothetical protein
MLYLSPDQPTDPIERPYPIQRVPATGSLAAAITSKQPFGCFTHFWGGRTIPCTAEACDACKAAAPSRWHCYMTAYSHPNQLHFLLELTAAAAEKIYQFTREHGTCRGCHFKANRQPQTPNGRIYLQTQMLDMDKYRLPEEPDLKLILSRLWNIPLDEIEIKQPAEPIGAIAFATLNRGNHDLTQQKTNESRQ